MDIDPYAKALAASEKKVGQVNHAPLGYLLQALLAGAYLTIVGFVFWALRQNFGADPTGKLISSLFFGVGLSVIVFTGTELFTSNNMYLTISTLARRTTLVDTARLWTLCWLGNLAGAVLVAALLYGAGAIQALPPDHALIAGAHHKMDLSSTEIFFKGILANWIVCLAVWVNLNLKDELSRLTAIILVVFIFLYLGFEHSIANMGTFAVALFADPNLPLGPICHNLFWATLGNIIGGGAGLGLTAWLMNKGALGGGVKPS
jgi:nitrite transporter NirC